MIRLECNRFVAVRQRLLEPPQLVKNDASIVEGVGIVGLERDCLVVTRQRLVETLQFLERITAIVVGGRESGIILQNNVELADGLDMVAPLVMNDPQQMQAIIIPGFGSENFSTGSLQYNRELGVVFSIASEVQKISSTIASDFSKGTAL